MQVTHRVNLCCHCCDGYGGSEDGDDDTDVVLYMGIMDNDYTA